MNIPVFVWPLSGIIIILVYFAIAIWKSGKKIDDIYEQELRSKMYQNEEF